MPVSLTSRYDGLPVYAATDTQGAVHPTIPIRPTSSPPADASLYHHVVAGMEDIEYLAWRYYGSSAAWWRVAEANPLVFPLDWKTGTTLNIPSPGDVGPRQRSRSF